MDDRRLLQEYIDNQSQKAFATLTERHMRLVYGICLRELQDESLAEDATQIVFIILAQRAKSLRNTGALAGWLFTTARFTARKLIRQEMRRKGRERQALEEKMACDRPSATWEQVSDQIDDALAALNPGDRQIVLMRFFEDASVKEVAELLGVAENTARMRAARAVERLRRRLAKAGIAVPAMALVSLLSAESARQAPAASAAAIAQAAMGGPIVAASPSLSSSSLQHISQGVAQHMIVTKLMFASVLAGVVALGTVGIYTARAHVVALYDTRTASAAAAPAETATGDLTIHFQLKQISPPPTPQPGPTLSGGVTEYISGHNWRLDSSALSLSFIQTVVQGRPRTIVLNPQKKTYTVQELSMPQLKKTMGVTVVDTGETTTLLGLTVRHYTYDRSTDHADLLMAEGKTFPYQPGWTMYSTNGSYTMPNSADLQGILLGETLTIGGHNPRVAGYGTTSKLTATSISTERLPASIFAVPAGYTKVPAPMRN